MDFVPEVHATCNIQSADVKIMDGIKGSIQVDQCNMDITSISVGIVQNENLSNCFFIRLTVDVRGANRDLRNHLSIDLLL